MSGKSQKILRKFCALVQKSRSNKSINPLNLSYNEHINLLKKSINKKELSIETVKKWHSHRIDFNKRWGR
jgi:hypothetical protein